MTFLDGILGKGRLAVAALLVSSLPQAAWADIMVRVEESFNGQLPMTALHWFGPERSTRDDGNRYVVTRLDEGRIYTIDRLAQNYTISSIPRKDSAGKTPDVRALKKEGTRSIGKWTAQKYEVIGSATAGMKIVIWASRDIDINLKTFRNVMAGLARRPGSEWMAAYKDIDGFPILQEVQMVHKGATFTGQTRVIAVEEREPPEYIYQPPADYQRVETTQ